MQRRRLRLCARVLGRDGGVIAALFTLRLGSRARPLAGRPSQIIAQDAFSIVPRRRGKDSFTQSKRFLFDDASVFVVTGA